MATKDTALVETGGDALAAFDTDALRDLIAENLGGEQIDISALDRITVPAGGNLAWTVPTSDGERPAEAIEAVVIHRKSTRAYWATEFSGNTPPDCVSDDAEIGHGRYGVSSAENPLGFCAACPMGQWDSHPKGTGGQACKLTQRLFVLQPGDVLPLVINVPPSSLKAWRAYVMRLIKERKGIKRVLTRFTLVKEKSAANVVYSQIAFKAARELTADEAATVARYAESITPALDRARLSEVATATADDDDRWVEAEDL